MKIEKRGDIVWLQAMNNIPVSPPSKLKNGLWQNHYWATCHCDDCIIMSEAPIFITIGLLSPGVNVPSAITSGWYTQCYHQWEIFPVLSPVGNL